MIDELKQQNEELKKKNEELLKEIDFLRFRLERIKEYARWAVEVPFNPERWDTSRDPNNWRRSK